MINNNNLLSLSRLKFSNNKINRFKFLINKTFNLIYYIVYTICMVLHLNLNLNITFK